MISVESLLTLLWDSVIMNRYIFLHCRAILYVFKLWMYKCVRKVN